MWFSLMTIVHATTAVPRFSLKDSDKSAVVSTPQSTTDTIHLCV